MRSFKDFLVESSGFSLEAKTNDYLNEEFKTDAGAIRQLQTREYELIDKAYPIREKIRELESKRSSLMYRIAGMVTNLMNAYETGERYPQVEKGHEEASKELEKIDKELERLYKKVDKVLGNYDRVGYENEKVYQMLEDNSGRL